MSRPAFSKGTKLGSNTCDKPGDLTKKPGGRETGRNAGRLQVKPGELTGPEPCSEYMGISSSISAEKVTFLFQYVIGWFFGDPHMRTLDGYDYTFNGLGEYVLVTIKSEDSVDELFLLQGRTERVFNRETNEPTRATLFNAFAAVFQNSTKVSYTRLKA